MKERTIKIVVLSVVFVLAIIVFGYWINRGTVGMTADMDSATLPTLSFTFEKSDVNTLVGHKREMNLAAVRDTIYAYDESKQFKVKIHHAEEEIDSLTYEIYTLDGKEQLHQETVEKVKDSVSIKLGNTLDKGQEAVLKITLTQGKTPVYYYTRIVEDREYHVKECVNYVQELHNNILNKQNEDEVKKVMESNSQGDNSTLQHVTIHSDLGHVMWGDLNPELVNEVSMEIKEARKAYTSVLLRYQVSCKGDNNESERYHVQEFFKVAYGTERVYLLEYDRTMEEVFDTSNVVLGSKGIILGIAEEQIPYKTNKDGTIVAFVQGNELWNYNKSEDAFSLVFSFLSAEKYDERHYTANHSIQILSMEEEGNMTFSVSGYMNRGSHEGESGVVIYYYHQAENSIEEIMFVPSTESYLAMEKALIESAYYNEKQDVLYLLSDGTLRKIEMKELKDSILVESLEAGQYVASEDGHLFAYQKKKDEKLITEIWDFSKDSRREITVEEDKIVVPLGFIGDDFVYGVSKEEDAGYDASGAMVQAMHYVEIQNKKNEVVKTYKQENIYILKAAVENNMVTLTQGIKQGNIYKETSEDYITNNETSANSYIELKSYWTDLKQTQYRLTFAESVKDTRAKTLRPKLVLQERLNVIDLEEHINETYYYVYGLGKQAGVFAEAGEAIALADELSGVVVSPKQSYVWEADNRVSWYRNFEVSGFSVKAGETTLEACVRKVLTYEKKNAQVSAELDAKNVEQVMSEQLDTEVIRFRKCSVKDMFYLIDKGVPVIGLKDSTKAILIIGYDAKTATYIDPSNGGTYMSAIEKIDEMLKGSGNTFVGYVR